MQTPEQKASVKKYQDRIKKESAEKGVCYVCRTTPVPEGRKVCSGCCSKSTDKKQKRTDRGICTSCPNPREGDQRQCRECLDRSAEHGRLRREKLKEIVFAAYGGYKCNCPGCNETDPSVLQIDHVNNDGWEHRKQIKSKYICEWIIEHDFPDDFQILCANCNFSKRMLDGVCHHQLRPTEPPTQYDEHLPDFTDYSTP